MPSSAFPTVACHLAVLCSQIEDRLQICFQGAVSPRLRKMLYRMLEKGLDEDAAPGGFCDHTNHTYSVPVRKSPGQGMTCLGEGRCCSTAKVRPVLCCFCSWGAQQSRLFSQGSPRLLQEPLLMVEHTAYGLPPVDLLSGTRGGPCKHGSGELEVRKTPHNLLISSSLRLCWDEGLSHTLPSARGRRSRLCSAQGEETHGCLDNAIKFMQRANDFQTFKSPRNKVWGGP